MNAITRTRHQSKITFVVMGIILVALTIITSACRHLNPDYRAFTLSRGIGHFSFDYPTRYRVGKVEVRDEYTAISLNGPYLGEDKVVAGINIFINSYSSGAPDLEAEVDGDIESFKTYSDFRLIERSSIVLSNEKAEKIKYFNNAPPTLYETSRGLGPKPTITNVVYFVRNNTLWILRSYYQQITDNSDSEYESDFEHMLETFEIIE
jgi:hypothetical protein